MKEQEVIKQVEAIINSDTDDTFFIRGEQMVQCVFSMKALKHIANVLADNIKRKEEYKKPAAKRDWNFLMRHYRD